MSRSLIGSRRLPAFANSVSRVYLMNNLAISLAYTAGGGQINVTVPAIAPDTNDSVVCVEASGIPTASAAGATVFRDVGYTGGSAVMALGACTSAQLSATPVGPGAISSLRVALGFRLTDYSGDKFAG